MPKIRRERTKLHASLKPQTEAMAIDSLDTPMPTFTPTTTLGETFTVTRALPAVAPLTLPKTLLTESKTDDMMVRIFGQISLPQEYIGLTSILVTRMNKGNDQLANGIRSSNGTNGG